MTTYWQGKRRIQFNYSDASGNESSRDLELHKVFGEEGSIYLYGWSNLRKNHRTFRLDRVDGPFMDRETGERADLETLLEAHIPATRARRRRAKRSPFPFTIPDINRPGALVRFKDETDYAEELLTDLSRSEVAAFTLNDFYNDLGSILVELTPTSFAKFIPDGLESLGLPKAPNLVSMLEELAHPYEESTERLETAKDDKLISTRLLERLDPTTDLLELVKMPELRAEAKSLGIKTSQRKSDLIANLIARKDDLSFRFVRPTKNAQGLLRRLADEYIQDVSETLSGNHSAYAEAAWDEIAGDDTAPEYLLKAAEKLSDKAQRQRDDEFAVQYRRQTQSGPEPQKTATRSDRVENYVEANKKSMVMGFLLSLLFGPIGYLYVSPVAAIILGAVAFIFWGTYFVPFIIWVICVFSAPFEVADYNKKIRAKAELLVGE